LESQSSNRNVTQDVLDLLDTKQPLHTSEDFPSIPQPEIKAALDRLASRSMVAYETRDEEQVVLTSEAEKIVEEGSHEWKVWDVVKREGEVGIKELPVGLNISR
jgi:phenylalanyl-tRNA synthetase alpha chain